MKIFKNRKGFTLAELLIVVAIIGVLVAIAIPIFSAQLEKSRENTDIANLRSAKAAAAALYLDDNNAAGVYCFDAAKGVLVDNSTDAAAITGYGKGTAKEGGAAGFYMSSEKNYENSDNVAGQFIVVTILDADDGTDNIKLEWADSVPTDLGRGAAASGSSGTSTPASASYTMLESPAAALSASDSGTFRSDAEFGKFQSVAVDGSIIAAANYTASSGSTVVVLKPEYIATLAAGTHTMRINSTDGYAESTFTVAEAIPDGMMRVDGTLVSCAATTRISWDPYYEVVAPSWWGEIFAIDDSNPVRYNGTHFLLDSEGNYIQYTDLPELRGTDLVSQSTAESIASTFTAFFSGKTFTLTTLTPAEAAAAAAQAILSSPQALSCTIDGNPVNCSVVVSSSGDYYSVSFPSGFSVSNGIGPINNPNFYLKYNGKFLLDQHGDYAMAADISPYQDFLSASVVESRINSAEEIFAALDGNSYTTTTVEPTVTWALTVNLTNPIWGSAAEGVEITIRRYNHNDLQMDPIVVSYEDTTGVGTWTVSADVDGVKWVEAEVVLDCVWGINAYNSMTTDGNVSIKWGETSVPDNNHNYIRAKLSMTGSGSLTIDGVSYIH